MNSAARDNRSTIKLSNETFDKHVIHGSRRRVVLVFFWGPWCGLCRQLIPQMERLVDGRQPHVSLALADVREMRNKGKELGMQGLPSIFAFRDGEKVDYILGAPPIDFFEDWITKMIAGEGALRDDDCE